MEINDKVAVKKVAIVTLNDDIVIDLAEKHAVIYSDNQFVFSQLIFDNLKIKDLDKFDALIIVNFDRRAHLITNKYVNHPVLKVLKEKNYQGKLIISLDRNSLLNKENNFLENAFYVHDFYWKEIDKIKNFILT